VKEFGKKLRGRVGIGYIVLVGWKGELWKKRVVNSCLLNLNNKLNKFIESQGKKNCENDVNEDEDNPIDQNHILFKDPRHNCNINLTATSFSSFFQRSFQEKCNANREQRRSKI
jgi:hypothetical protein